MEYTFEFDEAKSRANRVKHGIDFVEAIRIISVRRSRAREVEAYEGQ
jgi:uncharacterized DUF497 family protein